MMETWHFLQNWVNYKPDEEYEMAEDVRLAAFLLVCILSKKWII